MIPLNAQGDLLVILFNGYGDAFLALPVLRKIIKRFQKHKIYFACFESHINTIFQNLDLDFVSGNVINDKIILDREISDIDFKQLVSLNAYYPNKVEIEIQNICPNVPRWGFCNLNGTPFSKFQSSSQHMRDQYFEVLGWKPVYSLEDRQLFITPEMLRSFDNFFLKIKVTNNHSYYTIHLDSLPEKMWGLRKWFKVIEYLRSEYNACPLILGAETHESEQLTQKFSFAHKLSPSLGLGTHFAAISNTDFFLGIDSIFAHVADSLQKQMSVLFGPTDEFIWKPVNPNSSVIKPPQGNNTNDIESDEVIVSVKKKFDRIRSFAINEKTSTK